MSFEEIVGVHPLPGGLIRQLLLRCAKECFDCAASCIACADVSLSENDQELIRVVRVALDCADAVECERYAADHEQCRLCADVCRLCKAACDEFLAH